MAGVTLEPQYADIPGAPNRPATDATFKMRAAVLCRSSADMRQQFTIDRSEIRSSTKTFQSVPDIRTQEGLSDVDHGKVVHLHDSSIVREGGHIDHIAFRDAAVHIQRQTRRSNTRHRSKDKIESSD